MKMLKNDFSEKIEKLLYNQNLRKKLSKAELILIKEIEKRDDEDKVSLQDQFRINVLRDALDKFERTEEEIREFQILLKDEREKEDIVEIGWEEKAIEGG